MGRGEKDNFDDKIDSVIAKNMAMLNQDDPIDFNKQITEEDILN